MINVFDLWNELKKQIDKRDRIFYVKERQVWYVNLGKNIGYEQDGKGNLFKRPVLVIKKLGVIFFVVPLTRKGKDNKFYYKLKNTTFNKPSFCMLSQVRILDKKRFIVKIGTVDKEDFEKIKKSLFRLLL